MEWPNWICAKILRVCGFIKKVHFGLRRSYEVEMGQKVPNERASALHELCIHTKQQKRLRT